MVKIGFILGSGLVDCFDGILTDTKIVKPKKGLSYKTGKFGKHIVYAYPRHGDKNGQPIKSPVALVKELGYEKMISEMASNGIEQIFSFSAVGALDESTPLADSHTFVIPTDYLRGLAASQHSFCSKSNIIHPSMGGEQFDKELIKKVKKAVEDSGCTARVGGLYIYDGGDAFETGAEIKTLKFITSWFKGDKVVGMTTVPEVILSRQMGIKYVCICSNVNYAQGVTDMKVSHEQTHKIMVVAKKDFVKIIKKILETY